MKALKERAGELEKQLKEAPDNKNAQRELLDVAAVLGDNKRSRDLAEDLVKTDGQNADSWLALVTSPSPFKGAPASVMCMCPSCSQQRTQETCANFVKPAMRHWYWRRQQLIPGKRQLLILRKMTVAIWLIRLCVSKRLNRSNEGMSTVALVLFRPDSI